MTARHTIAEIDEMRKLTEELMRPIQVSESGSLYKLGDTFHHMDGRDPFCVRAVDPAQVEDRLRTYLTAGIAAEDIRRQIESQWNEAERNRNEK